jgi:hypothetical protein
MLIFKPVLNCHDGFHECEFKSFVIADTTYMFTYPSAASGADNGEMQTIV